MGIMPTNQVMYHTNQVMYHTHPQHTLHSITFRPLLAENTFLLTRSSIAITMSACSVMHTASVSFCTGQEMLGCTGSIWLRIMGNDYRSLSGLLNDQKHACRPITPTNHNRQVITISLSGHASTVHGAKQVGLHPQTTTKINQRTRPPMHIAKDSCPQTTHGSHTAKVMETTPYHYTSTKIAHTHQCKGLLSWGNQSTRQVTP